MDVHFTAVEEAELLRAVRAGIARPACPRCETTVSRRDVRPRRGVAYVRDRIWLVCGGCGRSVVFDRRVTEREDPGTPG